MEEVQNKANLEFIILDVLVTELYERRREGTSVERVHFTSGRAFVRG